MPPDEEELSGPLDRWATWVFAVAAVVAVPYALYQGRTHWFFLDDWDFLSVRQLGSLSDLLRSHNGHWSTLPIIEYRILYRLFGLHHYWPYQIVGVLAHVATATLLYVVMRRTRVNPWIATAAGVVFLFFGSGIDDIESAFQIGFTAALAFGLAFLLLVDRDAPLGRRDMAGVVCGFAALLSSGVGVAAVAAVGAAVLLRRGWKVALVLVGPLGAVFFAWYLAYGKNGSSVPRPTATQVRVFLWGSLSSVFGQIAQVRLVGWVLFAVLVAGTVVAVRTIPRAQLRSRFAAVAGLFVGGLVFVVTTSINRGFAVDLTSDAAARVPRYLYVIAAFFLPAIAAAASVLARRRILVAAMVVLLLVGLPGNVDRLRPVGTARLVLGRPQMVVALAHSPLLAHTPADMQPSPFLMPGMTAGWLRNAVASGTIPMGVALAQGDRDGATLALSLEQVAGSRRRSCRTVGAGQTISLARGDEIQLPSGLSSVTLLGGDGRSAAVLTYIAGDRVLRAVQGPLDVQVTPPTPPARVSVCT